MGEDPEIAWRSRMRVLSYSVEVSETPTLLAAALKLDSRCDSKHSHVEINLSGPSATVIPSDMGLGLVFHFWVSNRRDVLEV